MTQREAVERWWAGLDDDTRSRVRQLVDDNDVLPADIAMPMAQHGITVAAACWSSTQAGPSGFNPPQVLMDYLEDLNVQEETA